MRTYHLLYNLLHHRPHSPQTLTLLYLAYVIRAAIFSFLSIFLPIYYFQYFLGLGATEDRAWMGTIAFFIAIYLVQAVSAYAGARYAARHTLRGGFLLSTASLLVFALLLSLGNSLLLNVLSALAIGVHLGFWWELYHLDFSVAGKKTEFGRQIGTRQAFGILTAVVTPLFAGFIISRYGYPTLYAATVFLVLLLGYTLLLLEEKRKVNPPTPNGVWSQIRRFRQEFVAYLGVGGETVVAEVLWPLLLFVLFQKAVLVGAVTAIVSLIAFVVRYVSGVMTDRVKKDKIEFFGALSIGGTWLGKFLTQGLFEVVLFDVFHKILSSFFYIPMIAVSYLRSLTEDRTAYITGREMVVQAGKIIVLLVSLLVIGLGGSFWWLILFGALSPLLTLFYKDRD